LKKEKKEEEEEKKEEEEEEKKKRRRRQRLAGVYTVVYRLFLMCLVRPCGPEGLDRL
jgi:hypothetical protein